MALLTALAPLGLAFLLILSGRASVANAGLAGAALALGLAAADLGVVAALDAGAQGLWIGWLAISIIVAGLFFQKAALAAAPGVFTLDAGADEDRRSRAFAAVFLLGVFVESASGFGLGAIAAVAVLQGLGMDRLRAAALALLSLALVPWGALAIGTGIAAGLTGIPIVEIGVASAWLSIPVLGAALMLFWLWAPGGLRPLAMATELAWLAALLGLLWAANTLGAVEVAGVIAAGALFALRWALDRAHGRPTLTAAPFAGFAILIVALRLVPGLTPALGAPVMFQPWPALPAFSPLAHASFWLLLTGAGFALAKGIGVAGVGRAAHDALRAAKTPTLVTAGYVILGAAMSAAGAPGVIAAAVSDAAGPAAAYASPVFAAVAGWLTGSNAAAHGMLVELQAEIGAAAGVDPLAAVATQNVVASAFTMISPMRVALVAATVGLIGQETTITRRLTFFIVATLAVGWAAMALR